MENALTTCAQGEGILHFTFSIPTYLCKKISTMKFLIWGVIGIFLYMYFRKRLGLTDGGEGKTTIHHHHYHGDMKKPAQKDDDYIDYEELKK